MSVKDETFLYADDVAITLLSTYVICISIGLIFFTDILLKSIKSSEVDSKY